MLRLFLALTLLAGCSKIVTDVSPASIESNYPTAIFSACGQTWLGLGYCLVDQGDELNSVDMTIDAYYKGSIKVDGSLCGLSDSFSYNQSGQVPVIIPGVAQSACLITFTLAPTYPNQDKSGMIVYGFRGQLLIKVLPKGSHWVAAAFKETGTWHQTVTPFVGPTPTPQNANVMLSGCGVSYNSPLPIDSTGHLNIPLDLMVSPGIPLCAVDGLVVHPVFKNTFFDYFIAQYDINYAALPVPAVVEDTENETLSVSADASVSVLALNSSYKLKHSYTFQNVDFTQPLILRALTIKGRTALGTRDPATGVWTWAR